MVVKTRVIATSVAIRGDHKQDQGPIKVKENVFKKYCIVILVKEWIRNGKCKIQQFFGLQVFKNPKKEYRGGKVPMNRYKTEHEEKLEKTIQETPYHVIPRLCLIVVPLDHLIIKKIAAHVDLRTVKEMDHFEPLDFTIV